MDASWDGPVGIAFDALTECQAILDDNAPDTLAKFTAVLDSPELLRAMYAVGFFPNRNDPGAVLTFSPG
jgi:hypothetical protein